MRVVIRCLLLGALVLTPAATQAAPILPDGGTWTVVGVPTQDGLMYWDNPSDSDCKGKKCNAGEAILGMFSTLMYMPLDPSGAPLEYLHNGKGKPVPFAFDPIVGWRGEFSMTALNHGYHGQLANGAVTYTVDGPGNSPMFLADSLTDPRQFALFRQVGTTSVRYYVAFEDTKGKKSDYDYNDLILSFEQLRSVPEPSTLALLGSAFLGVALRRRRSRG